MLYFKLSEDYHAESISIANFEKVAEFLCK